MALSVRRNVMNVVRNYSDAEIKVREATSNDPWGPSSSLMAEIADMTYNTAAFSEIMTMIWKRVNDHGKNWRHVYKALVLLDYLIKTGSERVAQQCKENIFAIQTLKDFQFVDRDVKDQGSNVREKSKQLVSLLKDDERLKSERAKALKAKERFQQVTTGIGSDSQVVYGHGSKIPRQGTGTPENHPRQSRPTTGSTLTAEIEQARPQTAGEEELQLQLALSMSKEEAENERKKQESDAVRLEMALSESAKEANVSHSSGPAKSSLVDLTAAAKSLKDPWGGVAPRDHHHHQQQQQPADPFSSAKQEPAADPWGAPAPSVSQHSQADPWTSVSSTTASADPWSSPSNTTQVSTQSSAFDPFESSNPIESNTSTSSLDFFDSLAASSSSTSQQQQPFDLTPMSSALPAEPIYSQPVRPNKNNKAENFLGGASDLVNLDNLVTPRPTQQQGGNPFLNAAAPLTQPTQNQMSLNQMKGINTPAVPASGSTIMAPPMAMSGPSMMPGPYGAPMVQPAFGMQQNLGFGVGMGTTPPSMMGGGVGMPPQPSMGNNMGGQMSNNPFF